MFEGSEILIAEDSEVNYFLLKELLNPTGATYYWAKNGSEALDLLDTNEHISIVLMDISMPIMDGITATKKIREMKISIPIIFQTAFENGEYREKCFAAGGNEFLSKPLSWDKLFVVLKKYLVPNQA